MHLGGLLSSQELKVLVYWRHQHAQWEYKARSHNLTVVEAVTFFAPYDKQQKFWKLAGK